jgi:hypothetical protein
LRRKWIIACLFILACAPMTRAQGTGSISGKVVDVSGSAISGAVVSVTDLANGAVVHATTGVNGRFQVSGLSADRQLVTVEKTGFEPHTGDVSLATQPSAVVNATLTVQTLSQSIVVRGTVIPGARPMPTRSDVLTSDQTLRILDRKQLDAAGPLAGGAQMISYTPGANVIGYGNTGSTKYTIQLNGIQQGWAGENTGDDAAKPSDAKPGGHLRAGKSGGPLVRQHWRRGGVHTGSADDQHARERPGDLRELQREKHCVRFEYGQLPWVVDGALGRNGKRR